MVVATQDYDGLVKIAAMARVRQSNFEFPSLTLGTANPPALPPGVHDLGFHGRANVDVNSSMLSDIRSQLSLLLQISTQQAEQIESLKRQVKEQSTLSSATNQCVHDLRSQVNSLRVDVLDTLRGSVAAQGTCNRALMEERRNTRRAAVEKHGSKTSPRVPTADKASGNDVNRSASDESSADVSRLQSAYGFTRSPPGLSKWSAPSADMTVERVGSDSEQSSGAAPEPVLAEDTETVDQAVVEFFEKVYTSKDADACTATAAAATTTTINSADADAWTVLHYAALYGYDATCQAVLQRPDFKVWRNTDRNGNTALHIAVLHDKGDVCSAILKYDSEMMAIRNHFGETPIDLAKRRGVSAVCMAFAANGVSMPSTGTAALSAAAVTVAAASL